MGCLVVSSLLSGAAAPLFQSTDQRRCYVSIFVVLSLSIATLTLAVLLYREMRLRRALQRLAARLLCAWREHHEDAAEMPDHRAVAADERLRP
jgi:hypothetical protein